MELRQYWFTIILTVTGLTSGVYVHFENKDVGFFLKHPVTSPGEDVGVRNGGSILGELEGTPSRNVVLRVDRFTVLQTSQPVSVRANYEPFSTKQTVPARYIVPDPVEDLTEVNLTTSGVANLDLDLYSHNLDISAHVVTQEVQKDSPVLRVLFHTGQSLGLLRDGSNKHSRQQICIVLYGSLGGNTLTSVCNPGGKDGICLAQITIPSKWWPSHMTSEGKPLKTSKAPKTIVQVSYSVFEPRGGDCNPSPSTRIQIQPLTYLAKIPLTQGHHGYREVRVDERVHLKMPKGPFYLNSKVYVPVHLKSLTEYPVSVFVLRARVKSGLKIIGAQLASDQWNISVNLNSKHIAATVTAFRKDLIDGEGKEPKARVETGSGEVFSWLLEVEETTGSWEGGKVVWTLRYMGESERTSHLRKPMEGGSGGDMAKTPEDRRKMTTRLDIEKDDIQAVLPISKNWELINTAQLTGKQASQPMKVFIVSQAGKVADVTLQSSCQSEDESILKVSSACTSVYTDGSEIRGSVNATILVKYGTYTGHARFTVWMPELPLEVHLMDSKLSQIKGWKTPQGVKNKVKRAADDHTAYRNRPGAYHTQDLPTPEDLENDKEVYSCKLCFQQTPVDVYAKFVAKEQNSGRVSYFLSRKTSLRITDLVQDFMRVADTRIASLEGRIVQGHSIGRTEVQVLSPITRRVIGLREVRVCNDKVTLDSLSVNVVSGLQLAIQPDTDLRNGYIAQTSVTRKLTARYQEGLLDIDLHFSDGSKTPLREVSDNNYYLAVESLDSKVVEFAPTMGSHHPRVIAIGQGKGKLLKVELELASECLKRKNSPLATSFAYVNVDFRMNKKQDFVQNDGGVDRDIFVKGGRKKEQGGGKKGKNNSHGGVSDLGDISGGTLLRDDNDHELIVQARQHPVGRDMSMTPLEIGMYVLLGVFCLAIGVFVISCVVYASKFKQKAIPKNGNSDSVTNAHDWVWLGRATLERASINTGCSQAVIPTNDVNGNSASQKLNKRDKGSNRNSNISYPGSEVSIRITTNPNFEDHENLHLTNSNPTSTENPNHVQHPVRPSVDSSTYSKSTRLHPSRRDQTSQQPTSQQAWQQPQIPQHQIAPNNNFNNLDSDSEGNRPPVPPHRNIGVTAKLKPEPTVHQPGRGYHQLGPGCYGNQETPQGHMGTSVSPVVPPRAGMRVLPNPLDGSGPNPRARRISPSQLFVEGKHSSPSQEMQFTRAEDKHQGINKSEEVVQRQKQECGVSDELPDPCFVDFTDDSATFRKKDSPEVKQANIVGNPMFSANVPDDDGMANDIGLDCVNTLGMDYEELMDYFDNLKESNA